MAATIDQIKDPLDVYAVRIPARTKLRASTTPKFGNPDLAVYSAKAKTVTGSRYRLTRSRTGGKRVDRVVINNTAYKPLRVFLVVSDNDRSLLNSSYTLRVGP